jgi:hypothetical protein
VIARLENTIFGGEQNIDLMTLDLRVN